MTAFVSARRTVLVLCLACSLAVVTGCKSNDRKLANLGPEQLYKMAHTRLTDYDYKGAIKLYENLTARYPFTAQARQARLDLIYAYYRQGESESATDAADTFIRENPTHPRVDYAWYIKGLVDFDKAPNAIEHLFHADLTKRPPTNARKSFEAFRTVVEQYPKSAYAYDAHQRMVYLRNRLANYEVHVADYYMRRGAYVGAAQRANRCIEEYDGAPATRQALQIMIAAYTRLGLKDRAEEVRQVYAYNFANTPDTTPRSKHWWQFWAASTASVDIR
ncbi:MAG TPA: outer membrane protein assembly factor BamD [Steroidobacteraceae bacterium]|nr:outer membrane protein assembly factor BamD [Steroidobacteraceae bacterium]